MLYKKFKLLLKDLEKWVYNLIYPYKVTILIGSEGSLLCAYYKTQLQEVEYMHNDVHQYNNSNSLQSFVKKYKKAKIFIFLDNQESFIKHVDLTVLESLIPRDAIQDYANKEFSLDHLYACKVLSVELASAEKLQAIFTASPLNEVISYWLEETFTVNNFRFGNIYFVPLEAHHLIYYFIKNYIEAEKHKELLRADVQVLLCVTKTTGIRIIAEQNRNILLNSKLKYPKDKSLDYIQGTIEHELNETLLSIKHISEYEEDLSINITMAVEEDVYELLKELKFNTDSQIILNVGDLNKSKFSDKIPQELINRFDLILSDLIFKNKSYKATNSNLKKLLGLRIFNRLCSKPFFVGLFILLLGNVYLKYSIVKKENIINQVSREYYKNLLNYKKLKNSYPNIEYFDQAIEVLLLQNKLKKTERVPFDLLREFMVLNDEKLEIENITWNKYPRNSLNNQNQDFERNFTLQIKAKFISNNSDKETFLLELAEYIKNLKIQFRRYRVEVTRGEGKLLNKTENVVMPILISISG